MKANDGAKYIFYIILFVIFLIFRANYIYSSTGISEIEFKSLAISSLSFPFGILKETTLNDYFMPIYYYIVHFGLIINKSEIFIRILNSIIALFNIFVFVKIGQKLFKGLKGFYLGFFIGIFLSFAHFFLFYTNLIVFVLLFIKFLTISFLYFPRSIS